MAKRTSTPTAAETGTATKRPTKPNSTPKANRANINQTGCSLTLEPTSPVKRARLESAATLGASPHPPELRALSDALPVADPTKRLTAEEGLPHNLFVQFYDPDNIPRAPRQVWIHLDDNQKQSTSMYRDRLYEEITKRGFNRKPGLDAAPTGAAG